MKLSCIDCHKEYSIDSFRYLCDCGNLLDVIHDFKSIDSEYLKQIFNKRLADRVSPFASGVWRYKELISPELETNHIVTKYEGNTGLYKTEKISNYIGNRCTWVKAQSENPSGSFKDNGMTVAVSHGYSLGKTKFTCTSTGNTSSSLAMYASLANSESYVFVPNKNISVNKVLQTLSYGAKVITFEGTYDNGIQFLEKYSDDLGLYVCNSINPFRIEGQKSIIYEIAQYLQWKLPDWVIVPGGALSNVSALGKGLNDLYTLGFIDKIPRVAVVQAEGASPFHKMVENNQETLIPNPNPDTVASALNIGDPPSWKKGLRTLEQTNGITVSVTDEEILNAKAIVDQSGIGCEPASASTVAGLKKLVAQNVIDSDETAVCILTGNLLKDTEILKKYHLESNEEAHFANSIISAELTIENIKKL
ncbi:threonine synthase [Lysinibacillus agricola]|uniref:Threonine synthase n=1 Tax=Lysinibacillus agricola TaxID=2590012 RepID=A0ABX7AZ22_9BACI|nr:MULTISPECIES: threonine synthase [Lysinibacillus]KOS60216.1 L-threonine synthase [Lysinibacillus sp. FJAT-14222]QQP14507.1 threonine synthase [Lysinibacillus agricola]